MNGMTIQRIEHGTRQFAAFEDALAAETGKAPGDFHVGEDRDAAVVLGRFDDRGGLEAFTIFQSFLDPTLHLGGMIDPEYYKRLQELEDVAIFNIGLIHTMGGKEDLAARAAELIGEFEKMLLERHEAYCLLISMFKEANKMAFPMYRKLGFKKEGGESYFMDIDPRDVVKKYGRAGKEEGSVVLKTFGEMSERDMESLAKCYGGVFTAGIDVPVLEHLRAIIGKPAFLADLSVLVCDKARGGDVIGFCFIEKQDKASVYINAAGLARKFRGGDISMRSFSWVMQNCFDHGYAKATLVTATKKLRKVFSRAICARYRDTLVWLIKCGARDDDDDE